MKQSKGGDSGSFAKLSGYVRDIAFSYYQSKFHQKRIKNIDDVEDLTQSVYLTFAEQYHNIEELERWLRRVLFLSFVRWYKKNKSKTSTLLSENILTPEKQNDRLDLIDAETVLSLLGNLSEEKQEIVKLRFWGELKFQEIAEKMNKSEAAVKKMFYRTLIELKENLE